ncbi:MAG: hypothetical protein JXI33_00005 [Candidatus Aminicenantes bacterium]|nr:hypothetical protein [Candidatus Aminicenantes bacterium]
MNVKTTLPFFFLLWASCAILAAEHRRLSCDPQFPVVGQRVTFSAVNFHTPNLLRWDMGDGMVFASGSTSAQDPEVRLTYTYMTTGVFEVKVYDDNGDVRSTPLTLLVWVKADAAKALETVPEKTIPVPDRSSAAPVQPVAEAVRPDGQEIIAAGPFPEAVKKNPLLKIGPYGGIYLAQDAVLKTVYGSVDVIYGARFGVRLWRGIYFWLSAARFRAMGKTTLLEEETVLILTPLSAFLRLGLSLGNVKPYAGIGFTTMSFKEESEIGNTNGHGNNVSLEAGFELQMNRNFLLDFGARFDQIKIQASELEEKIDLGGLQVGVALLISF